MKDRGIKLEPINWAKPKLKPLGILRGVTKIITGLVVPGNASTAIDGAIDVSESIGFEQSAGRIGWLLISKSLTNALCSLIVEPVNGLTCKNEDIVTDDLDKKLDILFEDADYFICPDFFTNPAKLPLINASIPIIRDYLSLFPFEEYQISNILNRFKSYFVFSLVEEWRKNHSIYQILTDKTSTPFSNAESKEYQWYCYNEYLKKIVKEPVFQESFSLEDIYIPLRGYYDIKEESGETLVDGTRNREYKKRIVRIDDYILNWINDGNKTNALKLISGGPGYGKSSLLKMLAAKLAEENKRVLFIPLHRFELKNELEIAIQNFLHFDKYINYNPLEEDNLIIIFDGLDELSMQGEILADSAQKFLREVQHKVDNYNYQTCKLKVIISGRDVIIQQNESDFRKKENIIRLLPYHLNSGFQDFLIGDDELKKEDQRDIWWKKYGLLKGKTYEKLPAALIKEDLDEITAQPLLNYLVALSFERGRIDFSFDTNLNVIYNDLIEAVYARSYSTGGCLRALSSLNETNFRRLLEEISLSAWHGNGRTTTIKEIQKHFTNNGLGVLLKQFVADAEKGVISLLAAFYFRQAGQLENGSQTFEFTHKSFGEYLMGKRIVSQVQLIHRNILLNESSVDEGYDIKQGLKKWIELFGPKSLDLDIIKFIRNEINSLELDLLNGLQKTIIKFINYELKNGMPIERLEYISTYKEENQFSTNSERALFIILSIISQKTDIQSKIEWSSRIDFGNLLNRIEEQREGPASFMLQFLNHLDLDYQRFPIKDLYRANLFKSSLKGCSLEYICFMFANLSGANLSESSLSGANLSGADLTFSNLSNAGLEDTNINSADIGSADLRNSHPHHETSINIDFILNAHNFKYAIVTQQQFNSLKASFLKKKNKGKIKLEDLFFTIKEYPEEN
jgi:uncharacterized protein YjbI with pentapeptide repeats/DNA polymerase III delta prime subunit